jgi:hypothetical protein
MKKPKDNILEAYEEMLINESYYTGLWKRQFYAKEFTPMFLDHRSDFSEEKKESIQKEKKKFVDDMAKLELSVIGAIQKMDKRSDKWDKWLKKEMK